MGRPRTVELDDAVVAAVACFREHGFEATSIRDLESATGLKATSLYNAFGSKAGLFRAVLDRYRVDVVDRRIDEHLRPDLGVGGIRSFFVSTYTIEPSPSHGCLVTNSVIEFAAIDTDARNRVEDGLGRIRDAFAAQLDAAVVSSEHVAHVDVDVTADLLLVLYEGMLTMLRAGQETRVDFARAVDAVLAPLIPNYKKETP
jgi:TetR/AcrR family transcriptional regulator, transcriptional repressor for nem operon